MKAEIISITTLVFLCWNPCVAQGKAPFYGIQDEHIQTKVEKDKHDYSTNSDSITSDELSTVSTEQILSLEQLEEKIRQYEQRLEHRKANRKSEEPVYSFYSGEEQELSIPNLIKVMKEVGLSNQLFVLAQAVLETGNFSSRVCNEDHNLFGLTNPRTHTYYKFARWEDSVIGYQKFIQYRYKGGNYLAFLKHIGYAEAPNYTNAVAKLARQLYKQLCSEGML